MDQPAFHALAKVHREMHDVARTLALKKWDGGDITAVEHDVLTDLINEFNSKARHLSRAFGKAFSDMDPLTGIHNRQQMLGELEVEWTRFLRACSACCIALADLDHFKKINDAHGHHIGNEVLRGSVSRFVSELRPYDTIFRYGGEEFLLCLPNTELHTAIAVLDRLRVRLSEHPMKIGENELLKVTASFGLAEMDRDASLEELIERADKSLYKAKQEGRNRVCYWDHKVKEVSAVAYPHGLVGEKIPIVGRVTTICDVFDALTSGRPYKGAWSVEAAVDFIRSGSGTLFAPGLVGVFVGILPEVLATRSDFPDP